MNFAKQTMNPQDAARILGVSLNASENEITKTYRQLALRWHPDRNPGNEAQASEMMKKINEAYAVLKEYVKNRTQQDNVNQNQNQQPNNNSSALRRAWQNLQHAIRDLENAESDLAAAIKNREIAHEQYVKAMNDFRKTLSNSAYVTQMHNLYNQACQRESQCYNKVYNARIHKIRCEAQYQIIAMGANYSQKSTYQKYAYRHANQRCA